MIHIIERNEKEYAKNMLNTIGWNKTNRLSYLQNLINNKSGFGKYVHKSGYMANVDILRDLINSKDEDNVIIAEQMIATMISEGIDKKLKEIKENEVRK